MRTHIRTYRASISLIVQNVKEHVFNTYKLVSATTPSDISPFALLGLGVLKEWRMQESNLLLCCTRDSFFSA